MKILILGSTGMLGSSVLSEFSKKSNLDVVATYRDERKKKILFNMIQNKKVKFIKIDILKKIDFKLKKLISNADIIINCIGLINQKIICGSDLDLAFKVNTLLPYKIFSLSSKKNKIYHITTDGVFNGKKGNYKETDVHKCLELYSFTKSMGEVCDKNFYNIRCSILGKELTSNKSLFSWFLNVKRGSTIKGYTNHIWNGVTANVLSKILLKIVEHKINIPNKFHLIPKDKVTKFTLLRFIKKSKKKSIKIIKYNTKLKLNRTLSTNYKKLNLKLWKITFGRQLTIKEMINKI